MRTHAQKYFLRVQRENGTEAPGSSSRDDEGLSNRRRSMSEGDLFRVRLVSPEEKSEERGETYTRGDDGGGGPAEEAEQVIAPLSTHGNSNTQLSTSRESKDDADADKPAKNLSDGLERTKSAKKPPMHPGRIRKTNSTGESTGE